jgi:hypothetical protein
LENRLQSCLLASADGFSDMVPDCCRSLLPPGNGFIKRPSPGAFKARLTGSLHANLSKIMVFRRAGGPVEICLNPPDGCGDPWFERRENDTRRPTPGSKTMITVREKLMSEVLTNAERELLDIWFQEHSDPYAARQRAWEEVARRGRPTGLRPGW